MRLPELIFFGPIVVLVVGWILVWRSLAARARRLGYSTTGAYLRAVPRSDPEKRDAADLTLRGLVWCMLGLVFSPLVLVGLMPLFYGGRKLAWATMGLGLVDDGDQFNA
jgi:hypothetical protein